MKDTVYDASFVKFSLAESSESERSELTNQRWKEIEGFIVGKRKLYYNQKLGKEYNQLLKNATNDDSVQAFIFALVDTGIKGSKNGLSRQKRVQAQAAGWPTHDDHLLSAALLGTKTEIFVTEQTLANCGTAIKRIFKFVITRI